jgi:CheY-like chemotaxis protein
MDPDASGEAVDAAEPTRRILVVDPDKLTRNLYRQSFALIGCDVVEACDGREALANALIAPPALVVTEAVLPFVDGFGLCDILRRDRATAAVPILVVTSEARPAEIDRIRRIGADVVLVKPTTPDRILAETQQLMAHAAGRQGPVASTSQPAVASPAEHAQPRARLSKSLARVTTTTPPSSPPAVVCPACKRPLIYEQSYLGGVNERHREQWDRYACPGLCGTFEYRQRTRKLRCVE